MEGLYQNIDTKSHFPPPRNLLTQIHIQYPTNNSQFLHFKQLLVLSQVL